MSLGELIVIGVLVKLNEMKIESRIKGGILKGYTIRKSKYGWYSLYSDDGISQTQGKLTLDEVNQIVKMRENYHDKDNWLSVFRIMDEISEIENKVGRNY